MMTTNVMRLSDKEPFGIGGRRLCFVHPENPARCIKVLRTDPERTVRIQKRRLLPAWMHPEYDNNRHEKLILDNLMKRIGPAMTAHLPRSYGMIETDMGLGLELDLIRDADGKISRSIRELSTRGEALSQLQPAWQELGDFLLKHVVLTRGLLDHNIVARINERGERVLYIIDGLGDPAWIPFAAWMPALGRKKVRKRLLAAWPRFEELARKGGVSKEALANSSWGQGILKHRE